MKLIFLVYGYTSILHYCSSNIQGLLAKYELEDAIERFLFWLIINKL